MTNLPENYKEGIERVSNIVSYKFPFKWTEDEKRYKDWLYKNNIREELYLKYAQDMWTLVHNALEEYILYWRTDIWILHKEGVFLEYDAWAEWLDTLSPREIYTEKYVCDSKNRYQWSCDLLYQDKEWKWVLADYKTYGICKKRFPQLKPKETIPAIATKKKKKVQLQMSLYAKALYETEGIKVDRIELLYLHEHWMKLIEFPITPDKEIEELLTSYAAKDVKLPPEFTLFINYDTMQIEVQTVIPWEAYSKASVIIEETDMEGKTPEEKIGEAVRLQKHLIANYKKANEKETETV